MTQTPSLPSPLDIDELLAYLPILTNENFQPVITWHGGIKNEDGVINLPYPKYDQTILDFFKLASKECWLDYGYDPVSTGKLLQEHAYVRSCSLEQIRTLLTYCIRGERFMDGHWEIMIKDGYIQRILLRLAEIRSQMK